MLTRAGGVDIAPAGPADKLYRRHLGSASCGTQFSRKLAQVSLELGGKSPFIVFDDANIESAVNGSIAGILVPAAKLCGRIKTVSTTALLINFSIRCCYRPKPLNWETR